MSNNTTSLNSKGFKWTLGSLGALVGILSFASPYLNANARIDNNTIEIKDLKHSTKEDHDTLIRMSSDLQYVKDNVNEIKILLQQDRSKKQIGN